MTRFLIALCTLTALASATTSMAGDMRQPLRLAAEDTGRPSLDPRFGSEPTLDRRGGAKPTTGLKLVKVSPAPARPEDPVVSSTHGDWQIRCDKAGGQCALMQSVVADDRAGVGLSVIVIKRPAGLAPFMRVLAPLGVMMPSGLGLGIDGRDLGRTGFIKCLPNGCIAEVEIDQTLISALGSGQVAIFEFSEAPKNAIGVPISLDGFKSGFDALP